MRRSKITLFIQNVINEIQTVIVGQQYVLERLLIGVLAEGHILLEGVPGLAKTLTIKHWQIRHLYHLIVFSLPLIYCLQILLEQ